MRIILGLIVTFVCISSSPVLALDQEQFNEPFYASGPNGPAPNSGDGIPDGSGNDAPFGPNKGKE